MPLLNFPLNPVGGDVYPAPNGVNYTFDDTIGTGVWLAEVAQALTIVNPGTITGTAQVGATLTYTTGTAAGGTSPYNYSWVWKYESTNLQVPGTNVDDPFITIPAGAVGDRIYVTLTVTDATSATASANTTPYPAAPATIQSAGITNAAAPITIPGTATFNWADGPDTLSASGCIEFSVNGGVTWQIGPQAVTNSTTVVTRWVNVPASGTCGDASDGTNITGALTTLNGLTTTFNLLLDRVPNAFTLAPSTESTTPLTITAANPTFTLTGSNAPSLIWGTFGSTGSTPEYSVDGGGTWAAIPNAPGTASVNPGATVKIRFTTGSAAGTETFNVSVGASTAVGKFQSGLFTVTVATAPFPGLTFNPAGGPNAAPASVNTGTLFGTASAVGGWPGASPSPALLTVTGDIQISINGGLFVGAGGPYSISNGQSLSVIWDPAAIAGAVDGDILNGSITNGTYTNSFQLTVDMDPDPFAVDPFGNLDPVALSSTNTSGSVTPTGFNVPIPLSVVGSTTNPMTTPLAAVGIGAFLATPQTVNPGEGIQLKGTVGGTNSVVYGVDVSLGAPAQATTWTAKTTGVLPTIDQPTISTPSAGQTGVGTPSGITITSSAYVPNPNLAAVGAHNSSDWQLYANAYPLTSTGTIGTLTPATAGTPGTVVYKNADSADLPSATYQDKIYGKPATDLGATTGNHPAFAWADALSINGYSDWYLPAQYELQILYVNLKPGTANNNTGVGINPYSVPARASNYTTTNPGQTSVIPFRSGGVEAFDTSNFYWSSTEANPATLAAVAQIFTNGAIGQAGGKNLNLLARVIRRIPIAEYTAAGSPAIGTYLKGGFYAGQISTAGNGTADYALIVAPAEQGTYGMTGGSDASFTINGADTDGFQVGWLIKGSTSNATGVITAINGTSIQYLPISGTFQSGETIISDPAFYSLTASSTADTSNLVSWPVAKPPLAAFTKYYVRVRYNSVNNPPVYTSPWSPWREFTTGSLALNGTLTLWKTATGFVGSGYLNGDGTNYFIGSENNGTYTASDPVTWTSTQAIPNCNGPVYTTSSGYVVGQMRPNASPGIWHSANGTTWTKVYTVPAGYTNGGPANFVVNSSNKSQVIAFIRNGTTPVLSAVYSSDGGQNWGSLSDLNATASLNTGVPSVANTGTNISGSWLSMLGTTAGFTVGGVWRNNTTPPVTASWSNVKAENSNYGVGGGVASDGTVAVAVFGASAGSLNGRSSWRSTDNGATWGGQVAPLTNSYWGVTYEGGLFMAYGASGSWMFSSNGGVSWTESSGAFTGTGQGISFVPGAGYVLVTNDGTNTYFYTIS